MAATLLCDHLNTYRLATRLALSGLCCSQRAYPPPNSDREIALDSQQNGGEPRFNAPTIPLELRAFSEPSFLLPGENPHEFELIRKMMIDEVRPETNIEWLWTLDLIELSWEILRYRRLKQRVLHEHRQSAIKAILLGLDGAGIPRRDAAHVEVQVSRSAAQWRDDPQAANEIEARLRRHGFDDHAVNAELYLQARTAFAIFDELMHAAQHRRMVLLREINARRDFSKRVGKQSRPAARASNGQS